MSAQPDVIVVGAGIVGAACSYYLARAGVRVQVLERSFPASGTSRACDGLVICWDKPAAAELRLGKASAALWATLADELPRDFEYRRHGSIVLAETEAGLAELEEKGAAFSREGVRTENLDARGLHSLEPNLAPDLPGGVFYPEDAQVDARLATIALLEEAERLGAVIQYGVEVRGVLCRGDGAKSGAQVTGVVTSGGPVEASCVVVAGGAWSSDVLREAGIELPVRPRKGHILVASIRHARDIINHALAEGSYAASVKSSAEDVQVALIAEKTASGTLLLGSSREFCGFDLSVRLEVIQAIAARAIRFLPALATTSVFRSYAGLRPWSPDHLPLIGPVASHPGLFLATGHEGAGIGLAPITGWMIASLIAGSISHGNVIDNQVWSATSPGRFQLVSAPDILQTAAS